MVIADECDAAHIIPITNPTSSYKITNGLLLSKILHETFDRYYWSINPKTLKIEYSQYINPGSIKNYNSNILINKLKNDLDLIINLSWHYNKFLETELERVKN